MEKLIDSQNKLTIDLYHGTSTIFLESILRNGLGAINPISDWDILTFGKDVNALCEQFIIGYKNDKYGKAGLFKTMLNQSNVRFQHGDVCLSPSRQTAVRYTVSQKYGSELLSTAMKYFEKLELEFPNSIEILYKKYRHILNFRNVKPSAILIQVKNLDIKHLLSETGDDPIINFKRIDEILEDENSHFDSDTQQINFRLKEPIYKNNLKIWLINITKWDPIFPDYFLHELVIDNEA